MTRCLVALVVATSVTWATEPGENLDCTDWEFSIPGLYCRAVVEAPCDGGGAVMSYCNYENYPRSAVDNEGRLLRVRRTDTGSFCGIYALKETQLLAFDGLVEVALARIRDRCTDPGPSWVDTIRPQGSSQHAELLFDDKSGEVLIPLFTDCWHSSIARVCDSTSYEGNRGFTLMAIGGLTTAADLIQSFTPSGSVSFRAPRQPEGLLGIDSFDTYVGPLPVELAQAEGMRCSYPTAIPLPGEYFEVPDALPVPQVGDGRYYVTAVTYQGETRYGRKASGGVLSGRDPSELPPCVELPPVEDGVGDGGQP